MSLYYVILNRKRSGGAANYEDAYKWYMSANEGLREKYDVFVDDSGGRKIRPCIDIVKRALRKELLGDDYPLDDPDKMKSCYLTGVLLYLPNLSINLCFFVDLSVSFEEVKLLANRVAEHREEFLQMKGKNAPRVPHYDVRKFVARTWRVSGKGSGKWDEGSLVAIRLAFPPEKFGGTPN